MKYLLLALLTIGCIYNEGCPEVVSWKTKWVDQCGITKQEFQDMSCEFVLSDQHYECTYATKRVCQNGVILTQHVDALAAYATTKIETQDGCIGYIEGPLEVR